MSQRSAAPAARTRGRSTRTRPHADRLLISPRARRALTWGTLAAGAAFAMLLLAGVAERAIWSGQVLPGVEVDGVSIGGDGEGAAYADLSALAAELEVTPLLARAAGTDLSAEPSLLSLDVDELGTLAAARRAGRSANPIEQVVGTVARRFRPDEVELRVHYDEAGLAGVLDGWQQTVSEGVVEGGLRFVGATVEPIYPQVGTGIVRDEAEAALLDALRHASRAPIELAVGRVEPATTRAAVDEAAARARAVLTGSYRVTTNGATLVLDAKSLAAAMSAVVDDDDVDLVIDPDRLREAFGPDLATLETPPVDARFEVTSAGTVNVVPSAAGTRVDMAAVGEAILRGERRIDAPLEPVQPQRTTAWARSLGITELVSTFTTRHPAGQARVTNIHRAADLVNNTVVEPGSVFSLNDTVGARTPERGFVSAPVFYGEFTEDVGGGVSQFATTLFNAVFFGGYEDVTHKPHSIYFSRYPMGREATVNYPSLDLKFRNDSNHGILIRTSYTDSSITVSFYGDTEGKVVSAEGPNVLAERPPGIEYIDWPLLPAGAEEEIESGYTGYDVEVFRVIERPGREPVRERFFWRYRMLPTKVLRGTAPPTTTTTSTVAPSTPPSSGPPTSVATTAAAPSAP
jgi:vancomycin resistance protein YoaR